MDGAPSECAVSSPPGELPSLRNAPNCCCGHPDCEFLRQNATALQGLENDVRQAATMGQALLVRHEAYMADAEQERHRMASNIEQLENEKRELEILNAQKIRENRDLLDQLDGLNDALAESDAQVKTLTAALHETHEELHRVSLLAARTETLERQLEQLEREQAQLQDDLASKIVDERSAVQRWRQAERTIACLQDQIDQIEREFKEERARHVEVVGRMERRHEVEKELQTAAGRLKGAAAVKTAGGHQGTNVVSHFVKDILQDNATLQMGIVELREMLLNSNEEVERLREQLLLHQPIEEAEGPGLQPSLHSELASPEPAKQDVELHVHHHYHGLEKQSPKTPGQRRSRKKRHSVTHAHFTPPRHHTPRSSVSRLSVGMTSPLIPSSAATILSQTAVTVPHNKRWSMQSTASFDTSSAPGSPYARSNRASSIFDRVFSDTAYDSSRPTSPESMASPQFGPYKDLPNIPSSLPEDSTLENIQILGKNKDQKPRPNSFSRRVSSPLALLGKSAPAAPKAASISSVTGGESVSEDPYPTIPEESEPEPHPKNQGVADGADAEEQLDEPSPISDDMFQPKLRRVGSHESFLSISGMDIHTNPSQYRSYLSSLTPLSSSLSSTEPVLSSMTAVGTGTISRRPGLDSSRALSRSLLQGASSRPPSLNSVNSADSKEHQPLTQKLGGWVLGKWGSTPSPTPARTPASLPKVRKFRQPGINQPGPIFGLGPEERTKVPFQITVSNIDADALGDALGE